MTNNILEYIYKKKYADKKFHESNHVRNILIHFLEWRKIKESKDYQILTKQEKDKMRLEYDCDAYYYKSVVELSEEESLRGDTMISFWTPYRLAIYKMTGWSFSKTVNSLKLLIKKIDSDEAGYLEVNKIFEDFAKICYTKGNFMLLPDRKMNTKRGEICEDRMDETLYQCFKGGALSNYFKNDDDVLCKWVDEQKLNLLFKDNIINRDNIIPFNKPTQFTPFYMSLDKIYRYVDRAVEIINERNK